MARSVAELLPRRFDDLSTEDVEKILRDAADPGESLFLEWKRKLTGEGVAKACAAFANTYGGLLVVGAHDETREAVGIPRPTVEPQVWIKDVLRSHVLPMPPFRARFHLRGRYVFYANNQAEVARDEIDLIHWMPIDPDPEGDLGRLSHMRATIRRSLGVRPHN
jgi:schlafen family protein